MRNKLGKRLLQAAASMAIATAAMSQTATAAPLTFVYKGAGCNGRNAVGQFETAIGRKVDGVTDFLDYSSTWANLLTATDWALSCWQGSGYKLNISVPLIVTQHSASPLHDLAAGSSNTYFTQIAKSLVSHGYGNAYIRLGWEFNGGWYPWSAASSPSLWIQGYRQAQAAMKAVPGAHFRFVWNPNLGMGQISPDQVYPGDDVVDVIGIDVYDQSWIANYTDPNARWSDLQNSTWGLAQNIAFAKKHNKPYAFPEWGVGTRPDGHGGGDDPLFVANMTGYVQSAEYAGYWDYHAGDFNGMLSGAPQPGALAAFMSAFGTSSSGSASNVQEEKNLGVIMKRYAANHTAETAPVVSCTNCHVATVQNAPGHWMMIVWATSAQQNATINWSSKVSAANLYDPNASSTPVKALGQASSATFALKANTPMIVAIQR